MEKHSFFVAEHSHKSDAKNLDFSSSSYTIIVNFKILYQINPNTRKPSANVDKAAREKLSVLSTVIPIA